MLTIFLKSVGYFAKELYLLYHSRCVIHFTLFLSLALSVHSFEKPEECQLTYISEKETRPVPAFGQLASDRWWKHNISTLLEDSYQIWYTCSKIEHKLQ